MTDFKDLLLNECGDLAIVEGDAVIVSGVDRIRQSWLIHIRTFLGEWFLNLNKGVPYIQKIFAKKITRVEVQRVFNRASLEVPGIIRVNNVDVRDIDLSTRFVEVTVEAVCDGIEGTVTFNYKGALPPDECAPIASSDFPSTVGDLRVWFDAQDLANVAYDPSAPSLELTNKAGAGNATGEGSGSNIPALVGVTPLNNRRAIYFDNPNGGSNDEFLRIANTQAIRTGTGAISIFVVCKPEDPSGTPFTRGLVSLSGFETTNYNRESYDVFQSLPTDYSGALFRPSRASVLIDGSMEKTGVTDWTAVNSSVLTKETGTPNRGLQNLKVEYGSGPSAGATQSILTVGKSYRVQGYVRGDGTGNKPRILMGSTYPFEGTTSTSWQAMDFDHLVSGSAAFGLYVKNASGAGDFSEFDSVFVEPLIIADGNCEDTGVTAWTAGASAVLTKETVSPYEGSRCLRIAYGGSSNPFAEQLLTSGKTYRIKAVVRSDGAAIPLLHDGSSSLWTGTNSTSWQSVDVVQTMSAPFPRLRWYAATTIAGYCDFDAITVEEVAAEDIAGGNAFDPTILSFIADGAGNLEIFRDGASLGSTANISEKLLDGDGAIGALLSQADFYTGENFFNGYVGEVLIYEGEIAGTDLTNLHNFLLNKWNF